MATKLFTYKGIAIRRHLLMSKSPEALEKAALFLLLFHVAINILIDSYHKLNLVEVKIQNEVYIIYFSKRHLLKFNKMTYMDESCSKNYKELQYALHLAFLP